MDIVLTNEMDHTNRDSTSQFTVEVSERLDVYLFPVVLESLVSGVSCIQEGMLDSVILYTSDTASIR